MKCSSLDYPPPGVLLTLLPLATIFLPTGVGEGTFCQGHVDSLQKKRVKTVGHKQRRTSVMR